FSAPCEGFKQTMRYRRCVAANPADREAPPAKKVLALNAQRRFGGRALGSWPQGISRGLARPAVGQTGRSPSVTFTSIGWPLRTIDSVTVSLGCLLFSIYPRSSPAVATA